MGAYLRNDRPWKGKSAAFTFCSDDGNDDNMDWVAAFEKFGLRFTAFVNENGIDLANKLTTAQVQQMVREGYDVGSHTNNNTELVPALSQATLEAEVDRQPLADIVGGGWMPKVFSYPYHTHDWREMAAVAAAGYIGARSGSVVGERISDWRAHPWALRKPWRYSTPISTRTIAMADSNNNDEATTKSETQSRVDAWKSVRMWAISNVHFTTDTDQQHTEWILEQMLEDGDVWIATLAEVFEYIDSVTGGAVF